MKAQSIKVQVEATITDESAQRCLRLLEMYLDDHWELNILDSYRQTDTGMKRLLEFIPAGRPGGMTEPKYIEAGKFVECFGNWYTEEGTENGFIGTIKDLVKQVPAADVEPVRRWIPVTDWLPEIVGTYLVTVNDGGIKVAIAQWWYDVLKNDEGYFVYDDGYAEDIVAWMPLPEPYKGGAQMSPPDEE